MATSLGHKLNKCVISQSKGKGPLLELLLVKKTTVSLTCTSLFLYHNDFTCTSLFLCHDDFTCTSLFLYRTLSARMR